jgi:hypothetical protein
MSGDPIRRKIDEISGGGEGGASASMTQQSEAVSIIALSLYVFLHSKHIEISRSLLTSVEIR